ncbi:MAG: HAD family hydrolase [Pseudomonadota bacterium]
MRLVIFDCDGVLVDSEPITNRLMAEELTRHGLPTTQEESIERFVGGTIQSVYERACEMGATLPDDWVSSFYSKMIDVLRAEVTIIPGIGDVLDALDQAAVQYCVASNGPIAKMDATLKVTGLWDRVEGRIYSAHDVGIAKPDPGLFLHAARDMGWPPEQCVVIEDSASGVRAAQAAKMRCFGFTADTPEHKLIAHDALPFRDMAALPGLLGVTSQ